MTTELRRKKIAELLKNSTKPVSASALAKEFQVSRQVVVGDVALLRAAGMDILATPTGYILAPYTSARESILHTIACNHNEEKLEEEIYTVVDNGGGMIDVIVEHPIYGQLTGQLNIFSRYDADQFIQSTKGHSAQLLSKLTDGVHLHTISCKDEAVFGRIIAALESKGILLDKN